jgi:PIN domain nuclease of toxin-antitoxin system
MTIVEIALLSAAGRLRPQLDPARAFAEIEENPVFQALPLTVEIGREFMSLGPALRDPADRVTATTRVHGLRLVTSDRRILASRLASAIA